MTRELSEAIARISDRYPRKNAALLPALDLVQKEYGWLSHESLEFVAESLGMPKALVKGVATFYSLYHRKPTGKHLVQLCTNVSCMLFGAETLLELLSERYGLTPGGTSGDGRFSLVIMECIGACDAAPAMLVDEELHTHLSAGGIVGILERYR